MIQNYFDKVFLINLPEAKERLKRAKENCAKVGVEFKKIKAISGTAPEVVMNTPPYHGWNRNAAALALTTLNLVKLAKKKKWKSIFIMEDDVDFIPVNAMQIFETAVRGLPEGWHFFHLNTKHETPGRWVSSCLEQLSGAWCCQAYAINHTIYDEYIERLEEFTMPIDNITLNIHAKGKSFGTLPCVVVHHEGNYSTLREKIVDY